MLPNLLFVEAMKNSLSSFLAALIIARHTCVSETFKPYLLFHIYNLFLIFSFRYLITFDSLIFHPGLLWEKKCLKSKKLFEDGKIIFCPALTFYV